MFQDAYRRAAQYTWPITLSTRQEDGTCSCGIATLTIVNKDGWFITAYHVIQQFLGAIKHIEEVKTHRAEREKIQQDDSLSHKAKQKKLFALGKVKSKAITNVSIWLGRDGLTAKEGGSVPELDLAWGRLEGFDPTWVKSYPVFKNPDANIHHGASLCKLGFPLYSVTPTFSNGSFQLPPGSVPFPLFPIEGISTRNLRLQSEKGDDLGWLIETSSPGLRGQSGGPIFDTKGRIWGLQCRTTHHELGFNTAHPQYLNSGTGPHVRSILPALSKAGVAVEVSTD